MERECLKYIWSSHYNNQIHKNISSPFIRKGFSLSVLEPVMLAHKMLPKNVGLKYSRPCFLNSLASLMFGYWLPLELLHSLISQIKSSFLWFVESDFTWHHHSGTFSDWSLPGLSLLFSLRITFMSFKVNYSARVLKYWYHFMHLKSLAKFVFSKTLSFEEKPKVKIQI